MPDGSKFSERMTEMRNPRSAQIDRLSTIEMLALINDEDARVAGAVRTELDAIARVVDAISARLEQGGRLVYLGAGTSGRLGVLDAAEVPPTFGAPVGLVIGVMAGGRAALDDPLEDHEDLPGGGAQAVSELHVSEKDCVVGLAASGNTPFVLGGLGEARSRGALTVGITCNRPSALERAVDIIIAPLVGPEVITGSTRMKAGTAQKMVLNMISTGVMVRLGKTYGNLMVDLQASNAKLRQRAVRIVEQACSVNTEVARAALEKCGGEVKMAIVALKAGLEAEEARQRLQQAEGRVRAALEEKG